MRTLATVHLDGALVRCPKCHDPEGVDVRADADGKVRLHCPRCGHDATLGSTDLLPPHSTLAQALLATA